jgi:hypothetical protein
METYDLHKIGKCIAWTGDHSVYEYGKDRVIKFSKFDFFLGREKAKEKSVLDRNVCAKYFGINFLDTQIMLSPTGRKIALVQPKIQGTFLSQEDLDDKLIQHQFKEMMEGYRAMLGAGYPPVDLIGGTGAFVKKMGNIFVTSTRHLYLFDATLLDPKPFPFYCRPFIYSLFMFALKLQNQTIAEFEKILSEEM